MNQLTEEIEVKNQRISGLTTAMVTGLIVFILLMMHFKIDPPKPEEEGGVAVSLGEPDAGGPDEVPVEAYQPPATPEFQPREANEQTHDAEAVPVEKTPEVIKKNEPAKEQTPVEDDIIKKMRENAQKNKANPTNSGDGDKAGNQGAKDGVNGGNKDGTGTGDKGKGAKDGISGDPSNKTSHSFGNRKMIEPSNNENCGDKGKVIVDVILKADGTVEPTGISPSTKSTNQCLRALAIKLARKTRFAPSADNKSNEGTITFNFTY